MALINIKNSATKTHPTRYYSKKQEQSVAKAVGGKQTANSGATMFGGKSDVSIDGLFNLECKTKVKPSDSITVKKEWIEKNTREALFDGHPYSSVVINFGPGEPNYYIIDESLFEELVDYLRTKEN